MISILTWKSRKADLNKKVVFIVLMLSPTTVFNSNFINLSSKNWVWVGSVQTIPHFFSSTKNKY